VFLHHEDRAKWVDGGGVSFRPNLRPEHGQYDKTVRNDSRI
jgi:hypothetical protein